MPDYPITYSVTYHNPPLAKDQVKDGDGACSTILIGAYVEGPNDTTEYGFSGLNEKGETLQPRQLFQIWITFATWLVNTLPDGGPKELCNSVRSIMLDAKNLAHKHKTVSSTAEQLKLFEK